MQLKWHALLPSLYQENEFICIYVVNKINDKIPMSTISDPEHPWPRAKTVWARKLAHAGSYRSSPLTLISCRARQQEMSANATRAVMRIYKAMVQSSRTPSARLNNMTSSQGQAQIQQVVCQRGTDSRQTQGGTGLQISTQRSSNEQ